MSKENRVIFLVSDIELQKLDSLIEESKMIKSDFIRWVLFDIYELYFKLEKERNKFCDKFFEEANNSLSLQKKAFEEIKILNEKIKNYEVFLLMTQGQNKQPLYADFLIWEEKNREIKNGSC